MNKLIKITQETNEPYSVSIHCNDTKLLKNIYHIDFLSEKRDYGIDIIVGLKGEDGYINAYLEDEKLCIDSKELNFIRPGEYDIVVRFEDKDILLKDKFKLIKGAKVLDENKLKVEQFDGDLVVSCDDMDYLNSLYKIWFYDEKYEHYFIDIKLKDKTCYINENGELIISRSILQDIPKGEWCFNFEALGYDWFTKEIKIK